MDEKKGVVVTIVNSNYPPSVGITGESAHELATFLVNKGLRVRVVHTGKDYLGGGVQKKPIGEIVKIGSVSWRKNSYTRLIASFLDSYRLLKNAAKFKDGPIIVMTDPQFLIPWASHLLRKRKWYYWSMDIYPEAFVAGRLVSRKNVFYKILNNRIINNPPSLIISLGTLQLNYLLNLYKNNIPGVVLPCGIWESITRNEIPSWRKTNKIILGYCGNLGEAHSKEFLFKIIDSFDTSKFLLVLSLYGTKSKDVLSYAENKEGIIILENVPKEDLEFIDIHLVTLLPNWNHICVPSKAVSAVCVGGAIVYCGTIDSDNWHLLNKAGWLINEGSELQQCVNNFFLKFSLEDLANKKKHAHEIANDLLLLKEAAFEKIYEESIK